MRRIVFLAFLAPVALLAQQGGNINTPITRSSIARVQINEFHCTTAPLQCLIGLTYTDSSDVPIVVEPASGLRTQFTVPSAAANPCTQATVYVCAAGGGCLADAMNTARTTNGAETGTAQRRQQYRVVGYLSDRGCLPGITPTP